jgi:hypothetical protein
VLEVVFCVKVLWQAVIVPVRSAQVSAFAGQFLQTLLPGLNWPAGHSIIASQLAPL